MMDVTFYDKKGRPACYTEDGVHIFSFKGKPLAYLAAGSVYSFKGKHLGWLEGGLIRDNRGDCVFFSENSQGGPPKPARYARPAKSARYAMWAKSARYAAPARPTLSLNWSRLAVEDFFS